MPQTQAISRLAALEIRTALRGLGTGAETMEEVAGRLVNYLYLHLRDAAAGRQICALVRLFKTHAFGHLPPDVQRRAQLHGVEAVMPDTRCLTLLASAGDEPAWNSRQASVGHQAIPLVSREIVLQSPMISQLLTQFGLDIGTVIASDSLLLHHDEASTYNVFHVPDAVDSPYVPVQENFVVPYGIKSVLGFGGPLTGGDLFAIIVFSKLQLSAETVEMFNGIALSAKLALLSVAEKPVFRE